MATINISIPDKMYKDVKRAVKVKSYTSVSELVRAAVRKILYEEITENGFNPAFEDQVLEAAMEPEENDIVLKTDKDIDNYFKQLKVPKKLNDKNKRIRQVSTHVQATHH